MICSLVVMMLYAIDGDTVAVVIKAQPDRLRGTALSC